MMRTMEIRSSLFAQIVRNTKAEPMSIGARRLLPWLTCPLHAASLAWFSVFGVFSHPVNRPYAKALGNRGTW